MEVVLTLVGLVGVVLLMAPRIQRRRGRSRRVHRPKPAAGAQRRRDARRARVVTARAPVAKWSPAPAAAAGDELEAWDDDLGWEGVDTPREPDREAWERWRATESPLAPDAANDGPEPGAELPSVERWRSREPGDDPEWLDDDGLGWEGAASRDFERAPGGESAAPGGESGGGGLWHSGGEGPRPADDDWSRSAPPSAPDGGPARRPEVPLPAVTASAATTTQPNGSAPPEVYRQAPAPAAPDPAVFRPAAEPTHATNGNGASNGLGAAIVAPAPRRVRRLHPVLLLAIYAAAGIAVVVLATTLLLRGGSGTTAKPVQTPAAKAAFTPTSVPTAAVGSTTDNELKIDTRAVQARAERRAHRSFLRNRAAARRDELAAIAKARAAKRRADKERSTRGTVGSGETANALPPPPPPPPPPSRPPPRRSPGCEFCIG